ncbi:trypsin-like serine protease [Saccharothrix syringae]|uniref:Serine protease n=1 Tax=Saccharothrix syringae TaxID=103733 RepID=A0A5Q0H5Z8_SACSY|nr:trypsin-like serine protease [Saccharothrix syringae]QFZ21280.1 serine protease [Saccharothrix syringae]
MGFERERRRWRVRLSDESGRFRGGGTMLDERHLLTCARVVGEAGGPDARVVVDFVGVPEAARGAASVVEGAWVPATEGERGDVALLRLERPEPAAHGAPLRRMPLGDHQAVRVHGFPDGSGGGLWTPAHLAGSAGEWVRLNRVGEAEPIVAGYRGGAVVDEASGCVVGVVVGHCSGDAGLVGWMIPVETVLGHLPLLGRWVQGVPAVDESLAATRADAVDVSLANALFDWVTGVGAGALWPVVTGDRGSAGAAALRLVVALADRERSARLPDPPREVGRPPAGSVVLAVDASGRTADEVRRRVDERLGRAVRFGGTVVVDAVDDAAEPDRLVEEVLVPLARREGIRVVAAFRRESSQVDVVRAKPGAGGPVEDGVPVRLGALGALVAELAAIEEHQVTVVPRFVGLPVLGARATRLRGAVNRLRSAWAAGDTAWVERYVGESEREVARALAEGRRWRAVLDGLVDRYDLLRARFDAYAEKARDHGLVEDLELGGAYGRAWDLLREPPYDLRAAEPAVDDYVEVVRRRIEEKGA